MKQEHHIEDGQHAHHVVQVLEDRLYEHNSNTIDKHDGSLFSRVVQDETGRILAGVAGWTWAGACEITQLWVGDNLRNSGIGKKLLEVAEKEAKRTKCRIILVKTYSFQAPSFYERHGYKMVHVIKDFPPGHRYYTLTKTLT